jgi:hypothetical protein
MDKTEYKEPAGNNTRNRKGQWVKSIPLAHGGFRQHCECGRKFWTVEGYRGHYALVHILHLGE